MKNWDYPAIWSKIMVSIGDMRKADTVLNKSIDFINNKLKTEN